MMKKVFEKFNNLSNRKKQTIIYGVIFVVGIILMVYSFYLFQGTNQFAVYTNDAYGVSIKYPKGWEVKENLPGVVVGFVSPQQGETDSFQENVSIVVQNVNKGPNFTLKQYTALAIRQLIAVFKDHIKVDESKPTFLGGQRAHRFVYHEEGSDILLTKFMHVWFLKDGKAYQITYAGLNSTYDNYVHLVNSMLKSFKLK